MRNIATRVGGLSLNGDLTYLCKIFGRALGYELQGLKPELQKQRRTTSEPSPKHSKTIAKYTMENTMLELIQRIQQGEVITDQAFDACLDAGVKRHSSTHYTPVAVAIEAAHFLSGGIEGSTKILDVGSGVGKFCLIAASNCENAFFMGVEQRANLAAVADSLAEQSKLDNLGFLCANVMGVSFKDFDAFYLFNPFYEHLEPFSAIDESIDLDQQMFDIYSGYVRKQLQGMPKGTRVASYFGMGDEMPLNYDLIAQMFDGNLKLWQRR